MPAIDPDLALRLAKATVDLYADSAQTMLEAVARRLARGIDEPNWETTKLLEQLRLRDEAAAVLERLQVLGPDAIEQAITEAYRTGSKTAASQLGVTATFGMTNTRAVAELVSETVSAVQSTHVQILRSTQDVYRQVISETSSRVVTGTQTRRQAAQSALDRFANKGVTGFVDSAGRNWNLESYTEMAMRTSTGHAQIAGALDRFEDEGNDLVIVSDAPQECKVCVVPGTVVSGPIPEGACRSEYSGDLVSIRTASGKHLSGTPDHPILTVTGWRLLKDLRPGDEVISHVGQEWNPGVVPHEVQVPSRIEDVLGSGKPVLLSGPTRRDLDGDVTYREVHVVAPDGGLRSPLASTFGQPVSELALIPGTEHGPLFSGLSDSTQRLFGPLASSAGGVGGAEHGPTLRFGGVRPPITHALRPGGVSLRGVPLALVGSELDAFFSSAGLHPGAAQVVSDYPTADAEGGAELLRALASNVTPDKIVSLSVREFRGHVWDLQTPPRWYFTNGIVSHNCRPWEGKILSLSGNDPKHPSLATAQAAGLHHANCRHALNVYVKGLTRRMTHTADPEGDAARQEQRRLERGIRQWKRRSAVALDETAKRLADAKVREWQAALREHVKANNLKRLSYREQIGSAI